ncbi:hypothetical protein C5Y93_27875 [Blastopirellula marina]|uniref:Uncharacterized protein n=1 Tax=Blastopirellula marina TaxID=124 RepID=A0A2S8GCI0_9BACT|nr:hypothetical protein C5Y93_27875 [Blastopirellula marina]
MLWPLFQGFLFGDGDLARRLSSIVLRIQGFDDGGPFGSLGLDGCRVTLNLWGSYSELCTRPMEEV